MVSRVEQIKRNAQNSPFKIKGNKSSNKGKHNKGNKNQKDDMDKFIDKLNTLRNLDEYTVRKITKKGEIADFIAEYFTNPKNKVLNTNQLRDIYISLKKIDNLDKNWLDLKLYYNLFLLDIQLKHEKNVIPPKFYGLMISITDIVNKIKDEEEKVQNIDKIILLMESVVGYQKFHKLDKNMKNKGLIEKHLTIDKEYLINLEKNDMYLEDISEIVKSLNSTVDSVKMYQLRKIFNETRYIEHFSNDWSIIEEKFYKLYPKLAYIAGRELIPLSFYKLLTQCMDVIDESAADEKIVLFKNFIKYQESLISLTTYENKKNFFKVNNNV